MLKFSTIILCIGLVVLAEEIDRLTCESNVSLPDWKSFRIVWPFRVTNSSSFFYFAQSRCTGESTKSFTTMRAVKQDKFGGPDTLFVGEQEIPKVSEPNPRESLWICCQSSRHIVGMMIVAYDSPHNGLILLAMSHIWKFQLCLCLSVWKKLDQDVNFRMTGILIIPVSNHGPKLKHWLGKLQISLLDSRSQQHISIYNDRPIYLSFWYRYISIFKQNI